MFSNPMQLGHRRVINSYWTKSCNTRLSTFIPPALRIWQHCKYVYWRPTSQFGKFQTATSAAGHGWI